MQASIIFSALAFLLMPITANAARPMTDEEVVRLIIAHQQLIYPEACPCPFNQDASGKECGRNSEYRKTNGKRPICYPEDISQFNIDSYRVYHDIPRR